MESVLEAIGNTPSVRLRRCAPANGAELWLKLEYRNPTGSMKDRMALAMVEGAERDGLISPGDTIVEYTGGSTGPALALVCQAKGYRAPPASKAALGRPSYVVLPPTVLQPAQPPCHTTTMSYVTNALRARPARSVADLKTRATRCAVFGWCLWEGLGSIPTRCHPDRVGTPRRRRRRLRGVPRGR